MTEMADVTGKRRKEEAKRLENEKEKKKEMKREAKEEKR